MTRLPCNNSAGLLLGAASALLLGLAISPHSVLAEDLSPVRIKAATSAVDSAMVKANTVTSQDWPTIGLDYAETRFSKLKQITSDNVKELGPVRSHSLGICCCRQRGCDPNTSPASNLRPTAIYRCPSSCFRPYRSLVIQLQNPE